MHTKMLTVWVCGIMAGLSVASAWADCVTISIAAPWTKDERKVLKPAADVLIGQPVTVNTLVAEVTAELCSSASMANATSAAVRSSAQTLLAAQLTTEIARDTERREIQTEVQTSQFCRNATYAEIASRIATQKAAVQTDIAAIDGTGTVGDVQLALTTMNNRVWAVLEGLARCTIGAQRLQQ